MLERVRIGGVYCFEVSLEGKVLLRRRGKNLVTTAGKNLLADVVLSNSAFPVALQFVKTLSFGTSAIPAEESQTALQGSELLSPRLGLAKARIGNEVIYSLLYGHTGAAIVVKEMGLFTTDAVGTGIMFSRFLPQQFTFPNGGVLTFSYHLRMG